MIVDDYNAIRSNMRMIGQADIVKWIDGDTAYYMPRTPYGVEVLSCWWCDEGGRYTFSAPGAKPEELLYGRKMRLPIIELLQHPL